MLLTVMDGLYKAGVNLVSIHFPLCLFFESFLKLISE